MIAVNDVVNTFVDVVKNKYTELGYELEVFELEEVDGSYNKSYILSKDQHYILMMISDDVASNSMVGFETKSLNFNLLDTALYSKHPLSRRIRSFFSGHDIWWCVSDANDGGDPVIKKGYEEWGRLALYVTDLTIQADKSLIN